MLDNSAFDSQKRRTLAFQELWRGVQKSIRRHERKFFTPEHWRSAMLSRRSFLQSSAGALAAGAVPQPVVTASVWHPPTFRLRPGGSNDGFDPWVEIDARNFRHNVGEVSRVAGGRPILAVVKNNAYGLGDSVVGPVLASCPEVVGLACVRVAEALALRAAGVDKPVLIMAEVSETEAAELVAKQVWLTCWLEDSAVRLDRLARQFRHPISVHLFIDTGLGREGMPYWRALPWIEDLATRRSVRIDGTYQHFVEDRNFDRVQLRRFLDLVGAAREKGLRLGKLHAAPSYDVFHFPDSRLDMVRTGTALFGIYPTGEGVRQKADLRPVYRLCARVVRVEQLQAGETAGAPREFTASRPTWIALLPIGHTDGYSSRAAGNCKVLIGGRLYPIIPGGISSAHTILEIGAEKSVQVGEVATLVGGDDPPINANTVGEAMDLGEYGLMTRLSPLLPRKLV